MNTKANMIYETEAQRKCTTVMIVSKKTGARMAECPCCGKRLY